MAKYRADEHDCYIDPASGVMRNILGVTDQNELARVEAALVAVRTQELATRPIVGNFDLAHLRAIHRHLFGDIYPWAGEIRTVDISKGGSRFASYHQIEGYAPQITRPLAREQFLRPLQPQVFSQRAAHYLGELNALHPFREGNGRSIREFVGQLAREAGYRIDWYAIDPADMTLAALESFHGDSSRMAKLIHESLRDPERELALDIAKVGVGEGVRCVQAEPGRHYSGAVVGMTDRYVVQSSPKDAGQVILHYRHSLFNTDALRAGAPVDI